MTALRILVADDHEIVRRGLCAILGSHAGWEVCGEAADGREAVERTKQLRPDVVVLDIGMPAWLLHPLPLAAILVTAANDHLLKGSGLLPGWLTGKGLPARLVAVVRLGRGSLKNVM